ncbi:metallophosphoesterase [Chitinimonas sp.]|uniref:metallophosphoesterase family protein n=1 Tax=Chitinimonas sp. TaxID=1934313 RepID=UPI0035B0308D
MLLALLSDLHANREALSACLDDAAAFAPDRYVFLGDYVGYGADPAWVVDTVMHHVEWGALAVLGNHDAAAIGKLATRMHAEAQAAVDWTAQQLSDSQRAFLHGLPMTAQQDDCLFVHANPWNPAGWEYITGTGDALHALDVVPQRQVFCGHHHDQALYHLSSLGKSSHFVPVPGQAIPLLGNRRWLAIVGSVGQPRDHNTAAAYALFDTDQQQLTFRRVPYDVASAAARIRASGLPQSLAGRLLLGQ